MQITYWAHGGMLFGFSSLGGLDLTLKILRAAAIPSALYKNINWTCTKHAGQILNTVRSMRVIFLCVLLLCLFSCYVGAWG